MQQAECYANIAMRCNGQIAKKGLKDAAMRISKQNAMRHGAMRL